MLLDLDSDAIVLQVFNLRSATPDSISYNAILDDSRLLIVNDQRSNVRATWQLAQVSLYMQNAVRQDDIGARQCFAGLS